MNKMIKKSLLLILIATILIAPSSALMQAHAQEEGPPPIIINLPSTSTLSYDAYSTGTTPPTLPYGIPSPIPIPDPQLPALPGLYGDYWAVIVTGGSLNGLAKVGVPYDPTGLTLCQQRHLGLFIGDPVDFTGDGTVNLQDLILMVQAVQSGTYNPMYDLNHDGVVNFADLIIFLQFFFHGLVVNQNGHLVRLPWMDITAYVDTTNHYVYGYTDHFSGFGCHH